jgi:hypothetical protein
MRRILLLVSAAALSSCAKPTPTPEQQLIQEAHDAVRQKLKDPESARFKEDDLEVMPEQGVVCGKVNAKNGFGGYTGAQEYVYVRGQGAALSEDDPDDFIKAVNACTEALKATEKRIEAETRNTVGQMDAATRANFENATH